jgi:hypothetical protein
MDGIRLAEHGVKEDTRDGGVRRNLGLGEEKSEYSGKVLGRMNKCTHERTNELLLLSSSS